MAGPQEQVGGDEQRGLGRRVKFQISKSKVQSPKSKIQSPKFKVQNSKAKVQNPNFPDGQKRSKIED
jgi:hypothetical protein